MHQITTSELNDARRELTAELDELRDTVKDKDNEIERLKAEIDNLKTLVQIEALRTELVNLKMLAAKENTKQKVKKR